MEKRRRIVRYLLSIFCVSIFLYSSTCFLFLPNRSKMLASYSYLGRMDSLSLQEISEDLTLSCYYPISDEAGLDLPSYQFQVTNQGRNETQYQISFLTGEDATSVSPSVIHYAIQKDNEGYSSVQTLAEDGVIAFDVLDAFATVDYSLKFWITEDTNEDLTGKTFQGIVQLIAVL